MNAILESLRTAASRPLLTVLVAASIAIWLVVFFLWLSIPVASFWQLILQAVVALALIVLPLCGLRLLFKRMGGRRVAFSLPLLAGVAAAILAVAYLPYKLIWWIPQVQSFGAQSASMALRFLVAGLLAAFMVVWLTALAAGPAPASSEPPNTR